MLAGKLQDDSPLKKCKNWIRENHWIKKFKESLITRVFPKANGMKVILIEAHIPAHISDIFNCYCANVSVIWNARKLYKKHKTFKFTLP